YAQKRFFNWIDIGNVKDFWAVQQSVLNGEVAHMSMPGTQIAEDVWVGLNTRIDWNGTTIKGPVYIGSGTEIDAGSTIIGPAWIGHGSRIAAGSKIERSVLFEYTRVMENTQMEDLVVCNDYSVTREGKVTHISDYMGSPWGDARDRRARSREMIIKLVEAGS
ncbi:MAG: NDP-sugar synthase, partial [Cyanobacteria bacterium]|nr:NDP-sugar synthase [Cyanobacteriota bacterium]